MAFSISVHRREDDAFYRSPPPDVNSDEFDAWFARCQSSWLYENPLGGGRIVFEMWHVPAQNLSLPLVGAIYSDGLRVEGEKLDRLEGELDTLEAFWAHADFSGYPPLCEITFLPGGKREEKEVPLPAHLKERLGFLREAIRIAKECDGILDIS